MADRAQDAARYLCQRRWAYRAAEFCAVDVHAARRTWAVADADGDLLRRTQREDARALAEEGCDPCRLGCRSLRAGTRGFRVRRGLHPGPARDALVALSWTEDARTR